ncbi:MAG: hypothetical protein JWL71_4868, partial [Acidobacteria bacterium]|nr:hypothetical protein [Acidobacteriota bacterium]
MKPVVALLVAVAALSTAAATYPTDQAAIAHVLSRAGFGPRPGDVERVKTMGLQRYVDDQLHPERIADTVLARRLAGLTTLALNSREIAEQYELPQLEARRQRKADATDRSAAGSDGTRPPDPVQQRANSVLIELSEQKLLRAIYSERQLQEVLTDFWFNHFNVDARKGPARFMLTEYERDTIRPHVLGTFRDLLGATAKSPAMLFYLDNWQSGAIAVQRGQGERAPGRAANGINENYARELMELHTLGVGGGYGQNDVHELARILTGWSFNLQGGEGFRFNER